MPELDPPWGIILADWYNEGAEVTIVLKNGAQFQGKVHGHPARWLENNVTLQEFSNVQHNIDKREIAAITAIKR